MIQLFDIKKAKTDLKTRDNEILKKYLDLSNKMLVKYFQYVIVVRLVLIKKKLKVGF